MGPVTRFEIPAPAPCVKDILRYAGSVADDGEAARLAEDCLREAEGGLVFRACFLRMNAEELTFMTEVSRDFRCYLSDCREAVLFAATVGLAPDRLIARYSGIQPSRALMHQAVGTERVEALCDAFCAWLGGQLKGEGKSVKPRFSPGYGDLPLEVQPRVFALLECPRRIGVALNQSLLMTPTKSVTAVVGIR